MGNRNDILIMKDYSQYHYVELYDMLNHINPYKYPERIKQVEKEIGLRKELGEIPLELRPIAKVSFNDILDFFLVLFSSYQILSGFGAIISSILMIVFVIGNNTPSNFIFIAIFTLSSLGLIWGGIRLIRRMKSGVIISFLSYILQSLSLLIFGLGTFAATFEKEVSEVDPISFFPLTNLFLLLVLFFFISKSGSRKFRDVFSDYITFSTERVFEESNQDQNITDAESSSA